VTAAAITGTAMLAGATCSRSTCQVQHPNVTDNLTMSGWSSLCFTELAFAGSLPTKINLDNYALSITYRKTISNLLGHVNTNGGWTVLGCHRLGVTKDASVSGAEDMTTISENSTMHFEMVVPTVHQDCQVLIKNNCVCGTTTVQAAS